MSQATDGAGVELTRQRVLGGVFVLTGLIAAAVLLKVFATIFFAIAVAYVVNPVYRWLRRRGTPRWWAGAATTLIALLGALAIFSPVGIVLYLRRNQLLRLLRDIPREFSFSFGEYVVSVPLETVVSEAAAYVQGLAPGLASTILVLLAKAGLFLIVLFGLLVKQREARRAALAMVPPAYHDVVASLVNRAKATLYAIFVLQAITGFGTFLIALPVFWILGYEAPFTLAVLSGVLQFAPIIGPSLLVGAVAIGDLLAGQVVRAATLAVAGGVLIGILPDMLIRPRFARRTAQLPGSLYFTGFTGGVLTLGPIGIIAGPLVVALFAESVSLLGEEVDHDVDSPLAAELSPAEELAAHEARGADVPGSVGPDGTEPEAAGDGTEPTSDDRTDAGE